VPRKKTRVRRAHLAHFARSGHGGERFFLRLSPEVHERYLKSYAGLLGRSSGARASAPKWSVRLANSLFLGGMVSSLVHVLIVNSGHLPGCGSAETTVVANLRSEEMQPAQATPSFPHHSKENFMKTFLCDLIDVHLCSGRLQNGNKVTFPL